MPTTARLRYQQQRDDRPDGTTVVTGICQVTRQPHHVIVPTDGLDAWLAGALVQVALSSASKETREFLLSGISPEGWRQTFGDD